MRDFTKNIFYSRFTRSVFTLLALLLASDAVQFGQMKAPYMSEEASITMSFDIDNNEDPNCDPFSGQNCHQHHCQAVPQFASIQNPVINALVLCGEPLHIPASPMLDRIPRPPSPLV